MVVLDDDGFERHFPGVAGWSIEKRQEIKAGKKTITLEPGEGFQFLAEGFDQSGRKVENFVFNPYVKTLSGQ